MSDLVDSYHSSNQIMLDNIRRQQRQARDIADAAAATLRQAQDAVDNFVSELEDFESSLNAEEEARVIVVGGPAGSTIFPQVIGALSHDRIKFGGLDDSGCRVVVIQHVAQLNLMFKAVKVGESKARRIGFHDGDDD